MKAFVLTPVVQLVRARNDPASHLHLHGHPNINSLMQLDVKEGYSAPFITAEEEACVEWWRNREPHAEILENC